MKKRTRKHWKTSTGVQLSLFAWELSSPAPTAKKTKNGGTNHRRRPQDDADPFAKTCGRVPLHRSSSTYDPD